jgi:uncharacterized repeat protein (TIGR02543 family)
LKYSKTMRRFLGMFLTVALAFSLVPIAAVADQPDVTTYTVTFDVSGVTTAQTVEQGKKLEKPADPAIPEGMAAFEGWYVQEKEEEEHLYNFDQPVMNDFTLTARFTAQPSPQQLDAPPDPAANGLPAPTPTQAPLETYTVTFEAAGVTTTQQVLEGETAVEPAAPAIPEGKTAFLGWYLGDERYDFTTPVMGDITLTAQYKDTWLVEFTDANGKVIDSVEVRNGRTVAPTSVEIVPPSQMSFDGWNLDGNPFDFSTPITGNIQLRPRFVDAHYVYFISNGSAVSPQIVKDGQAASKPGNPTREGYRFQHWSLTEGGEAYDFGTPVTDDMTLYAVWQGQRVNYTIVYWVEKPNISGDPGNDVDNYMYYSTNTERATAGTQVTKTAFNTSVPKKWMAFHHSDTATVLGNGTTVLNVYFKRVVYTIQFDLNRANSNSYRNGTAQMTIGGRTYSDPPGSEKYSIQAKFEQDLTDVWPTDPNATFAQEAEYWERKGSGSWRYQGMVDLHFTGWTSTPDNSIWITRRLSLTEDMLPNSGTSYTLEAKWSANTVTNAVNYWFEKLPGETGETRVYNGKTYVKSTQYSQQYDDDPASKPLTPKDIEGVTYTGSNNNGNVYNFFYNRNRHTLSFNTQGGSAMSPVKNIMYGETLGKYQPTREPTRVNYIFRGWYLDADCTREADLATMTMPNADLTLFAKWEPSQYRASFYDKVGGTEVSWQGVAEGDYVLQPHTYAEGEAYEGLGIFLGWYWMLPGTQRLVPYSWETPVVGDITLYGHWQTDGFILTYDAGMGTGAAPVDNNEYEVNVKAWVQDGEGLTPPQGKIFIGWQMDGQGLTYYPGSTIAMYRSIDLVARYINPANAIALTFKANYEGSTEKDVVWQAERGDDVQLPDAIYTRDAYELVGWADSADATEPDYALNEVYKATGNKTFYGVWKIKTYDVTFAAGEGGSFADAQSPVVAEDILHGTAWSELTVPTPVAAEGYYFAGWDVAFPETVTQSATYTATFLPKTPIVLQANGTPEGGLVYNGQLQTVSGFTGLPEGLTVTGVTAQGSSVNAGTYGVYFTLAEEVKLFQGDEEVTERYDIEYRIGHFKIQRADLTVKADDKTRAYGVANPPLTYTAEGLQGDDTLGNIGVAPHLTCDATLTSPVAGSPYAIAATGTAQTQNYNVTYVDGQLTITASEALTVSAAAYRDTYDAAAHNAVTNVRPSVPGATIMYSLDGETYTSTPPTITNVGALTVYVKASLVNYQDAVIEKTAEVTPATLRLTADNKSRAYGVANPALTYSASGLKGNDTLESIGLAGSVQIACAATPETPVAESPVAITLTGPATTQNYHVQYTPGLLTISDNDQMTVSATAYSGTYNAAAHDAVTNSSASVTGATITYSLDGVTYTSTMPTITNAGEQVIYVKASADNYQDAVTKVTATVSRASLTLTADHKSRAYGVANPTLTYQNNGLKGNDTLGNIGLANSVQIACAATPETPVAESPVAITLTGPATTDNYNVSYVPGELTITASEALTVSATAYIGTYDAETHDSVVSVLPSVPGATITYSTDGGQTYTPTMPTITNAGEQLIYVKASVENYQDAVITVTAQVAKAALRLTADNKSRAYGQPNPLLTYSVSGLEGNDTLDGIGLAENVQIACAATPETPVAESPVDITLAGPTETANYTVSYHNGSLEITNSDQLPLAATAYSGTYDAAAHDAVTNATSTVPGAQITYSTDGVNYTSTVPTITNAGSLLVYVKAQADNYSDKIIQVTAHVTRAALTLTADAKERAYGQPNPTLTYGNSGLKSNDTLESIGLANSVQIACAATPETPVAESPVAITLTGPATTQNYTVSYKNSQLTITASEAMTVSATAYTGTYDAAAHNAVLNADSNVSDAAITYSLDGVNYTPAIPTITNAGEQLVYVRASNPNYVTKTIQVKAEVLRADLTLTANNQVRSFGQPNPTLTYETAGLLGDDTVENIGLAAAVQIACAADESTPVAESPVAITLTGPATTDNYNIAYQPAQLTIVNSDALGLAATAYSGTYDATAHDAVTNAVSTVPGAQITYSLDGVTYTAGIPQMRNAGEQVLYVKAGLTNYEDVIVQVTARIAQAPAVILAESKTKVAGEADPEWTSMVTGVLAGDSLNFSLSRVEGEAAGAYDIRVTLGDNPNYRVTVIPGTLTISAAPVVPTVPTTPVTPTTPTTPAAVTPPAEPTEPETIPEPQVPAAPAPTATQAPVEIPEPEVPAAAAPSNGVWALLNLLLTIATGILMLVLLIGYFVGKKKKYEETEQDGVEMEETHVLKRKGIFRLLSILPTLGAIIAFILTENMSLPMVFVDRWTWLMVVIAVVQVIVAVLTLKKRKHDPDDDQPIQTQDAASIYQN